MHVVFDVGNVLIRWRPERAVAHVYPDRDEALAYLEAVGFAEWNYTQDGGRSFAEGIAALEAAHPGQSGPLSSYVARFGETIAEPISGTWELLDRLKARGHRLFAITNFAAETWPVALQVHPRLGEVFEDVVVSGFEKLLKPEPAIFDCLLKRNGLQAQDCLFIDDSPANVTGAQAVGMAAHLFTTPEALEADLIASALL
ncbi:HAD family hydrolase [Pararhodobacter zhoushanensis]|uniref:HAD family hydrolase n=1 Tax=Pararhodobacter zhoushanensis TaxID=2479545 RepID=UPI000F8CA5DF|nr:HAD family phosphatase [Pararhodobacter zhoushanensis]